MSTEVSAAIEEVKLCIDGENEVDRLLRAERTIWIKEANCSTKVLEALKKVSTFTLPAGTILFHQREKRFANGGEYPYAPANWFSRDHLYYPDAPKMNVYQYRVEKDIPNLIKITVDLCYDDLHAIIENDLGDMHKTVQTLYSFGFNGVVTDNKFQTLDEQERYRERFGDYGTSDANEYRLPFQIVKNHLTLVNMQIVSDEIASQEYHTEWYA